MVSDFLNSSFIITYYNIFFDFLFAFWILLLFFLSLVPAPPVSCRLMLTADAS